MKKISVLMFAVLISASFLACSSHKEATKQTLKEDPGVVTLPSGLKYIDLVEGHGPQATEGQTMMVHYVGTLEDGYKFDSSRDRNEPIAFKAFTKGFIKGWIEGVSTIKAGGKRKLIIPSNMAYGEKGQPASKIPPNATLIFEVEVLEIK